MNKDTFNALEGYYTQVIDIIMSRQNPITGLLPASTAITAHGDYTDAWVRDNVYSILAVWGVGLAYRRLDESDGKTVQLEQSTVKLMRGLLIAMMKQADKVETFKKTQDPLDALHAKYDTPTGDPVVGDDEWGHLQLDATSLFLLMLVQMTASGLRIVFTIDEVNFVQNLVHYIGRAYRTPDYGIWERGHKANHGVAEVNSSSVGMAKAALEAMEGFNLFGPSGGQASVIHVVPDEIARARITLESMLPRESLSKEVDAATLSVVGYPAFALEDTDLVDATVNEVVSKLGGRYGCKRFLRDGHQTEIEDDSRLYYEPNEMGRFAHIECEWPLFFSYLLLHHLFLGNEDKASAYRAKLEELLVEQDGEYLLPELYVVPRSRIDAERKKPHSQNREPNENVPLVWAQSLYILGALIQDGLLDVSDIDPIGRRQRVGRDLGRRVQFALVAEDESVQHQLEEHGVVAETRKDVEPITIREADELARAFEHLGRNERLGLSGRPLRHLRGLATSYVYTFNGDRFVFQPQFMNRHDFYLALDNRMLVERLKMELAYINKQWNAPGRPLVILVVNQRMLTENGSRALLEFMEHCQLGVVEGTPVQLGRIADFLPTSSKQRIDYLHEHHFLNEEERHENRPCFMLLPIVSGVSGKELSGALLNLNDASDSLTDHELLAEVLATGNMQKQLQGLHELTARCGLNYDTGLKDADGAPCRLRDLLEELYIRGGDIRDWPVIRRTAALLQKHDIDLEGAATEIIVRQKALSVSRSYSKHSTFRRPVSAEEMLRVIAQFNADDERAQILTQELILNLGLLIRSRPELFAAVSTIRTGQLLQLIAVRVRREQGITVNAAFDVLMGMPPHQLAQALLDVLEHFQDAQTHLYQLETIKLSAGSNRFAKARFDADMNPNLDEKNSGAGNWHEWRALHGSLGRYDDSFFEGIWDVVNQSKGLVIGDQWNPKRRLDHSLCADMTRGEKLFADTVDHLMNKTPAPDSRQLYFEAINVLIVAMQQNPHLKVEDTLYLDVILGHAVRLQWTTDHTGMEASYSDYRADAWSQFYHSPPHQVGNSIMDALEFLLQGDEMTAQPEQT